MNSTVQCIGVLVGDPVRPASPFGPEPLVGPFERGTVLHGATKKRAARAADPTVTRPERTAAADERGRPYKAAAKKVERQPRIAGEKAVATWRLRRWRRDAAISPRERAALNAVIAKTALSGQARLGYGGRTVALRPTVGRLLALLWADPNRSMSVERLCVSLYGHPVTLAAIRQTTFRASRAMERVGCPLLIHCRASTVLVRLSKSPFAGVPI